MMKRRIFLWMGLIVLFLSFGICRETLATEAYKVRRGDSIAAIAKKHGVSPGELKKTNGLEGNALKIGQSLIIPQLAKQKTAKSKKSSPPAASYTVKKGDTIAGISRETGLSVTVLKEMNNLPSNFLRTGQKIILAKADGEQKKSVPSADASTEVDEDEEDGDLTGDPIGNISLTEAEKDAQSNTELLGKWHNPEERKLFVKVATAFLGAPYRLGGASLRGIDCSAFVKKIYQLFDVSLPRTAKEQAHVGVCIARDDLIEGDLVFFNTKRSFGHVGIYIGNNEFVHASFRNKGIRIDNLEQPYFNKHFVKAVRLKGLDEEVL
jgi:peptidoglycan endopeptidase LytE